MHIPDGFLSPPVWATLDLLALPAVACAARKAQSEKSVEQTSFLGVMGAFVFAAQMVNFPVAAGTSAHITGAALLTATVGPAAAIVVLTAVLCIQALLFQDGGILALGTNILNLAVLGVLSAALPYVVLGKWNRRVALFAAGSISVLVSASTALLELRLSGVSLPPILLQSTLLLYVLAGLAEGLVTVLIVEAIGRINPRWVSTRREPNARASMLVAASASVLIGIGAAVASTSPDVLETTTARLGLDRKTFHLLPSPFANYSWAGHPQDVWMRIAVGLLGLTAVFVAGILVARTLDRRRA